MKFLHSFSARSIPLSYKKENIVNETIKYEVIKYFDTYKEGTAIRTLDKDLAYKKCEELNKKVKHLPKTYYEVKTTKDIK